MSHGALSATALLFAIALSTSPASSQTSPPPGAATPAAATRPPSPGALHVTTTLVEVPTLVRTPSDDLVPTLTAPDFRLTDNGIPQRLTLEPASSRPLSLVLLIQTGANAPRLFSAYRHLTTMLDPLLGNAAAAAPTRVAVVTFDSEPEAALPFTTDLTPYLEAINHPDPGDSGAAILDALHFSLDLLAGEPAGNRRAILLLSQPHDLGSRTSLKDIVRQLSETSTAVYSLTFSSAEASLKGAFTDPAHGNPPWAVGGGNYVAYFNLGEPLGMILTAMQKDSAAELAALSGGEAAGFRNQAQFDAALGALANHLPNRYLLSFQPTEPRPGPHTLGVLVPAHPEFHVSARTSYWAHP